jgi:hypothetical protein
VGDRQQNDSHVGETQITYQLVDVNTQYERIHWYNADGVFVLERTFNCVMVVGATLRDVWRERKPTRCNNQMFIINFCLNMFRSSLCPSSGE